MKEVLIQEYNNLTFNKKLKTKPYTFNISFVNGARCEIKGSKSKEFLVEFINQDNDKTVYTSTITNNMWCKTNLQYYINYLIRVKDKETDEVVHEHSYNAEGKRVYIHLDSKAIGDTLAWFPYVEEFRKQHNCKVVCSTFHNEWFESNYPDIEFISPGTAAYDLYAMYSLGWHYTEEGEIDYNKNPTDFRTISLLETASDILGVDHQEVRPNLTFKDLGRKLKEKYITIAPHASAHAKYWMYPGGWQTVIDHFNNKGYKVVMLTSEPLGDEWHDSKLGGTLTNVVDKTGDFPLEERANDILHSEVFVGLGSGLSWLSWSLNTPTVLISGFSKPYSEFKDCSRVFTPSLNICNGCFNKTRLNAGDWEWCPEHKDTPRQFECTKTITPSQVIKAIETELLKNN